MKRSEMLKHVPDKRLYELGCTLTYKEIAKMLQTNTTSLKSEYVTRGINKPNVRQRRQRTFAESDHILMPDGYTEADRVDLTRRFANPVLKVDIATGAISGSWAGKHLTALGWR